MSMAGELSGVLASVGSGALNVGMIAVTLVIVVVIFGVAYFAFIQNKRYKEYRVVIWERDLFGNTQQTFDDAGVFVDKKTLNKRFFLRRSNVGLEPDNIPYVRMPNGKKLVYLVRRGLKNFQFIKPVIADTGFKFQVTEEDVNWAVNSYERQKKLFQSNTLMQLLPFILLAFVSVIILVMFIYFFKDFGVLKEVALAFKDATTQLAQYKTGVVLQ